MKAPLLPQSDKLSEFQFIVMHHFGLNSVTRGHNTVFCEYHCEYDYFANLIGLKLGADYP